MIQMDGTLCATCNRILRRGLTFAFKTSQGEIIKCLYCSILHWPMLRRSLVTALVVGTLLVLLNQGDEMFWGS